MARYGFRAWPGSACIAGSRTLIDAIGIAYVAMNQVPEEMMEKREAERVDAVSVQGDLAQGPARIRALEQTLQRERIQAELLLKQERAQTERLVQQLRTIDGSRLWRAAQWLRRLVGRPAHVIDLGRQGSPAVLPRGRTMGEIFHKIFADNVWGSDDSRSGTGSDLTQTAVVREMLPGLLRELGVRTMLDIPCGDFHWMRMLDLEVDYIGADVVADIVATNTAGYANDRRRFQIVDIAGGDVPRVDLVFCRDLLVHFSYHDALLAISSLKRSGSTYLLTTTFTGRTSNVDIRTGEWRPLNLQLPPFDFPPPLRLINEQCTEGGGAWADKSLGLWLLQDL